MVESVNRWNSSGWNGIGRNIQTPYQTVHRGKGWRNFAYFLPFFRPSRVGFHFQAWSSLSHSHPSTVISARKMWTTMIESASRMDVFCWFSGSVSATSWLLYSWQLQRNEVKERSNGNHKNDSRVGNCLAPTENEKSQESLKLAWRTSILDVQAFQMFSFQKKMRLFWTGKMQLLRPINYGPLLARMDNWKANLIKSNQNTVSFQYSNTDALNQKHQINKPRKAWVGDALDTQKLVWRSLNIMNSFRFLTKALYTQIDSLRDWLLKQWTSYYVGQFCWDILKYRQNGQTT